MKKSLMFLLSVLMIFFTACGSNKNEGTAFSEVNTQEGITFVLKEDTLKRSRGTFLLTNETEDAISYGTHAYHFEQKQEGQWSEFTGTAQSSWSEDVTVLEAGESVELSYDWKAFCGNTQRGTEYRLIIMVNDSPVAAEFTGI